MNEESPGRSGPGAEPTASPGADTPTSERASPPPGAPPRHGGWLLAAAVVLCAANLRPAVASVGPVLSEIRDDLGLSAAAVSVLTALPVLFFGIGALVAPAIARRIGTELTLVGVLAVTTAGLVLRVGPTAVTLFAGTLLAGAAIAIANVLIPALVKREYAAHAGLMMGVYVGVLVGSASLSAGVAVPIAEAFDGSWRAALGVWAVPAAAALAVVVAVTVSRRRRSLPDDRTNQVPASLVRDPVAWQVTTFMALQSLAFYTLLSWLPTLFRSHGIAAETAGGLLSLFVILGVPPALLLPSVLTRTARQSGWAAGAVAVIAAGMAGLLLAPAAAPVLWAVLLGVGIGCSFPLALTLVVLRSRDPIGAAQLSAMSQGVGYMLAAAGPFAFGLLYDLSGGWTIPLLALLALLVPQALVGIGAGRDRYVGQPADAAHGPPRG